MAIHDVDTFQAEKWFLNGILFQEMNFRKKYRIQMKWIDEQISESVLKWVEMKYFSNASAPQKAR